MAGGRVQSQRVAVLRSRRGGSAPVTEKRPLSPRERAETDLVGRLGAGRRREGPLAVGGTRRASQIARTIVGMLLMKKRGGQALGRNRRCEWTGSSTGEEGTLMAPQWEETKTWQNEGWSSPPRAIGSEEKCSRRHLRGQSSGVTPRQAL